MTNRRLDKSHRDGFALSSASIGRAKASPTMTSALSRWVSTVSNSSAALKRRLASVHTNPPIARAMKAENWPVPCISGQAGSCRGITNDGPRNRSANCSTDSTGPAPKSAFPPDPSTLNKSSCRHMTPFGIPVVPPV